MSRLGTAQPPSAAPIRALVAHRLSNDLQSGYYNFYLSDPFILLYESVKASDLPALRTTPNGEPREIFHATGRVRVSLDPSVRNNSRTLLTGFASQIDQSVSTRINVGTSREATTFNAHRIVGPNPGPVFAHAARAPGTLGIVAAHNREILLSARDMSLPSPRLPLVFERFYRGQDEYQGPFGGGWDFIYNQKIVEVRPGYLSRSDGKILLVLRDSGADDTAASAGDVILHDGMGNVIHFRRATDTELTANYGSDPLLRRLGITTWKGELIAFLPPPGVFDALVRFGPSGEFLRVTREGMQYRYSPAGRLIRISDTYDQNRHEVVYTEHGEVRRIVDLSTPHVRMFELGYHRPSVQFPGFNPGLDEVATEALWWHRVAKLRDGDRRDVLYSYDAQSNAKGRLGKVEGIQVRTVADETKFSIGKTRATTEYTWDEHGIKAVSGIDPIGGTAAFTRARGEREVEELAGADGLVTLSTLSRPNKASDLAGGQTVVRTADNVEIQFTFTKHGLVEKLEYLGAQDITKYEYPDDVLLHQIEYPRGNTVEFEYESVSPNLRARANVRVERRKPNGAGTGADLVYSRQYNEEYNQPEGVQTHPLGRKVTITLENDARSVATIDHDGEAVEEFHRYPGSGQLFRHVSVEGVVDEWTYDASHGLLESHTAGGTLLTTYSYVGCQVGISGVVVGRPCEVRPPHGAMELFSYAEDGSRIRAVRGGYTELTWYEDTSHQPKYVETTVDANTHKLETLIYDQLGLLTERTIDQLETEGTSGTLTWKYHRDSTGRNRIGSTEHPDGKLQEYKYDYKGRIASIITAPHAQDFVFDRNGNLEYIREDDAEEHRFYDGHDRVERIVDAVGTHTEYFYTGPDLARTTVSNPSTTFGTLSDITIDRIDVLGRLRVWHDGGSGGPAYEAQFLQHSGQPTTMVKDISRGVLNTRILDSAGRPTTHKIEDGSGTLVERTTSHGASGPGQNRSYETTVHEAGNTSRDYGAKVSFSALDDLELVEDKSSQPNPKKRFGFDTRPDGVTTGVTVAPGTADAVTTVYPASKLGERLGRETPGTQLAVELDQGRRLRREGHPGQKRRYEYDTSQRLIAILEPDGTEWHFADFDGRNRPQTITMPGGSMDPVTYDKRGRLEAQTVTYGGRSNDVRSSTTGSTASARPITSIREPLSSTRTTCAV